ncbi:alpha/beta hydrolase fold domain-containing protein [Microbacterium sp.]|jgi:acetyl esterase|uniref:alpha/beta hydrolase fold domain-containing protein n=1 Tax=Microbacterium sp. TaxID=51671 RepID=UPI0037C55448
MPMPVWLADTVAKLMQRLPNNMPARADLSFDEITATLRDATIPTRHGAVDATLYLPPDGSTGNGVYVNFHGGGFVMRHPEQDDALCRYIAAEAGVTVVNVDYIPAPQSRFPGPVEQAYDVAVWAASVERPWLGEKLVLGGQSAGGALAAGAARLALEAGTPHVSLQVLMYPPLDLTVPAKTKVSEGKETLLARMGPIFDTAYCPDVGLRTDRLISPASSADSADLTGISPALIVTAEKDILREEEIRYAARLAGVGALREHIDLANVGHGFNVSDAPRELVETVYAAIARHVRGSLS